MRREDSLARNVIRPSPSRAVCLGTNTNTQVRTNQKGEGLILIHPRDYDFKFYMFKSTSFSDKRANFLARNVIRPSPNIAVCLGTNTNTQVRYLYKRGGSYFCEKCDKTFTKQSSLHRHIGRVLFFFIEGIMSIFFVLVLAMFFKMSLSSTKP